MNIRSKEDIGYRRCSISLMDNIADPFIEFDEKGICNYYYQYKEAEQRYVKRGIEADVALNQLVAAIKKSGENRQYDCITGVSGGVDSTYLALQAKKLGLRPLVVHFDNGWNSELSVMNIQNIISRLGFDLYTLVVDWNEFRDLQLAYLKASVVDIEALTDHAILGTLYRLADKHGIKYILSGSNIVTEQVLPRAWIWSKSDDINIRAIHKKFGQVKLKTFPFFSTRQKHYLTRVKGIQTVTPLNYLNYNKVEVKKTIIQELGWRDYGGKHYESIFTRFYQGYILPKKFFIDKRKAHLSNLIFADQITLEEAELERNKPIYPESQFREDYAFVLRKFNLSELEFEQLMNTPPRSHADFPHEKKSIWENYPVIAPFKGIWRRLKGE